MSLLDKASLIVTPNAYKESKLYSVVPNTTLGDMDVVRATTATRVNSAGLIEVVPRNLFTYSEQFENANWAKTNVTVNTNATNAPNGSLTAEKIIATAIDSNHILFQTPSVFVSNSVYNFSYYAKSAEYTKCGIRIGGPGYATAPLAAINLTNGSIISQQGFTSLSVTLINNGWYRISGTFTSGTGLTANIQPLSDSYTIVADNFSYLGNGTSGIFAWGAQLDQGSTATEYFPTTTRLNIPRIDYTNGSCPSLLVEPQRTNLLTYSEQFDNAAWLTLGTITVTPNTINSPSGNLTADLVLGAGFTSSVSQIYNGLLGSIYTNSFFIKNNNSVESTILIRNAITVLESYLNWNGAILTSITNVTGITTFQNYGNGWYRIISTYTALENSQRPRIIPTRGANLSVYLWGAQLELGTYPTSYIPTVASTVTRNADVISKTGISSLINSLEGCFFVEANSLVNGGSFRLFSLSDGTSNNRLTIGFSSVTSTLLAFLNIGGTIRVNNNISSFNQTSNNKILFRWGSGNFNVFVNGVNKLSLTSVTMPTANLFTKLSFDLCDNSSGLFEGNVKNVQVYKTALSDTECINLTTL